MTSFDIIKNDNPNEDDDFKKLKLMVLRLRMLFLVIVVIENGFNTINIIADIFLILIPITAFKYNRFFNSFYSTNNNNDTTENWIYNATVQQTDKDKNEHSMDLNSVNTPNTESRS